MHYLRNRLHTFGIVLLVLASMMLLNIGAVSAQPPAQPVSGTYDMQAFGGPDCPSPVDLCASGVSTGDITGHVLVVITSANYGYTADGRFVSFYTADITITSPQGNLYGTIDGNVEIATGASESTVTFTDGTRKYKKRTAALDTTGTYNFATGEEFYNWNGTLQVNP